MISAPPLRGSSRHFRRSTSDTRDLAAEERSSRLGRHRQGGLGIPLLVCHGRGGRSCQGDEVETPESHLPAPRSEIGPRVVGGIPELDQHVQRHQQTECVLAPGIVDDVLDRDERAPLGQRVRTRLVRTAEARDQLLCVVGRRRASRFRCTEGARLTNRRNQIHANRRCALTTRGCRGDSMWSSSVLAQRVEYRLWRRRTVRPHVCTEPLNHR